MPSSPNYIRNYQQEAQAESPKRKSDRQKRMAARRAFEKASGPIPAGMDVHHKQPLSKGGGNNGSNIGLKSAHSNRSYPRTSSGGMKAKRG